LIPGDAISSLHCYRLILDKFWFSQVKKFAVKKLTTYFGFCVLVVNFVLNFETCNLTMLRETSF